MQAGIAAIAGIFVGGLFGYSIFGLNLGWIFVMAVICGLILAFVVSFIVDTDWYDRLSARLWLHRTKETRISALRLKRVDSREREMINDRTDPAQFDFDHHE